MITIIDYNAGNIQSVCNALDFIWEKYEITNDKNKIKNAEKIIFPWVWNAKYAMGELKKLDLIETIQNFKNPFLWICLWMQLLFRETEEWNVKCLWIIDEKIRKFESKNKKFIPNRFRNLLAVDYKIPHMGWNNCILEEKYFYFVHSYFAPIWDFTIKKTNYILDFSSIVQKNNFIWVQFHPEKSWKDWLEILREFILK